MSPFSVGWWAHLLIFANSCEVSRKFIYLVTRSCFWWIMSKTKLLHMMVYFFPYQCTVYRLLHIFKVLWIFILWLFYCNSLSLCKGRKTHRKSTHYFHLVTHPALWYLSNFCSHFRIHFFCIKLVKGCDTLTDGEKL